MPFGVVLDGQRSRGMRLALCRGVVHDVEARPSVAGIPGSRRRVLDRDLAVGALDDDGRREARGLVGVPTLGGDREAVVLDEHRLPPTVDERVEDVQLDALGTVPSVDAGASTHIGIVEPARAKSGMRSSGVSTVIRWPPGCTSPVCQSYQSPAGR